MNKKQLDAYRRKRLAPIRRMQYRMGIKTYNKFMSKRDRKIKAAPVKKGLVGLPLIPSHFGEIIPSNFVKIEIPK